MVSRLHPSEQKGMSPYVKYRKSPYRYSDELNNWTAAIKKGDKAAADRHDRAWRNKFGIQARKFTPEEVDIMEVNIQVEQERRGQLWRV